MIEAAMIWNEPNNKSHWDPELDPDWSIFARTAIEAGKAIESVNPAVKRVLGGMSPIDPHWVTRMKQMEVLDHVDVIAVHGHGGATRVVWQSIDAKIPQPRYSDAWTELVGYVQEAVDDGGQIEPATLAAYLRELRHNAMAPTREWIRQITDGGVSDG